MAEETKDQDDMDANEYWKTEGNLKHGKEMIDILRKACNNEN